MDASEETVAARYRNVKNDEAGNKKEADANEIRRDSCLGLTVIWARHLTTNSDE